MSNKMNLALVADPLLFPIPSRHLAPRVREWRDMPRKTRANVVADRILFPMPMEHQSRHQFHMKSQGREEQVQATSGGAATGSGAGDCGAGV